MTEVTDKVMRPDPPTIWESAYSESYEASNYGKGLSGWVLTTSHKLIEANFRHSDKFSKILEVGAGTGFHFDCVKHSFDEYWMTDNSAAMLDQIKARMHDPRIRTSVEEGRALSFPDNHFDRVIACHVLEHLYEPHLALREWCRVLKPGGVLSIVLPCDPGLLWRIGRNFGPRRKAKKNGLDYDYVMAREHVNPINNLVAFLRYYFSDRDECWWPTRLPYSDINLIYSVNIRL